MKSNVSRRIVCVILCSIFSSKFLNLESSQCQATKHRKIMLQLRSRLNRLVPCFRQSQARAPLHPQAVIRRTIILAACQYRLCRVFSTATNVARSFFCGCNNNFFSAFSAHVLRSSSRSAIRWTIPRDMRLPVTCSGCRITGLGDLLVSFEAFESEWLRRDGCPGKCVMTAVMRIVVNGARTARTMHVLFFHGFGYSEGSDLIVWERDETQVFVPRYPGLSFRRMQELYMQCMRRCDCTVHWVQGGLNR